MIVYVIGTIDKKYLTKPGSGRGGWTNNLSKAWQFELSTTEMESAMTWIRSIESRLMYGNYVNPKAAANLAPKKDDLNGWNPLIAELVKKSVQRICPEKLWITKHDLVEKNGMIWERTWSGKSIGEGIGYLVALESWSMGPGVSSHAMLINLSDTPDRLLNP